MSSTETVGSSGETRPEPIGLRAELGRLAELAYSGGSHTWVDINATQYAGVVLNGAAEDGASYAANEKGDVFVLGEPTGDNQRKAKHQVDISDPGVEMFLAMMLDDLAPVAQPVVARPKTKVRLPPASRRVNINHNTDCGTTSPWI